MDGSGESGVQSPESASQRVADLRTQLQAAEAAAREEVADLRTQLQAADRAAQAAADPGASPAAAQQPTTQAVAPGDGTRPQDGHASPTAEGTGAIVSAPAAPAADVASEQPKPVLDLLKEAAAESQDSPHGFIEALRQVAGTLEADGRLVMTDLIGAGETNKITATVIKVLGELVAKV